jgi:hypothetical protein
MLTSVNLSETLVNLMDAEWEPGSVKSLEVLRLGRRKPLLEKPAHSQLMDTHSKVLMIELVLTFRPGILPNARKKTSVNISN